MNSHDGEKNDELDMERQELLDNYPRQPTDKDMMF